MGVCKLRLQFFFVLSALSESAIFFGIIIYYLIKILAILHFISNFSKGVLEYHAISHLIFNFSKWVLDKGRLQKKEVIFITLGSDPPPSPLKVIKIFSIFFDTKPFCKHFSKKYFFALRKAETTFLKIC